MTIRGAAEFSDEAYAATARWSVAGFGLRSGTALAYPSWIVRREVLGTSWRDQNRVGPARRDAMFYDRLIGVRPAGPTEELS